MRCAALRCDRLHTGCKAPALIFVTAHAEHAVQAFDLEAVDYLTKPVRLERLQLSLQKVERYIQSRRGLEANLAQEDVLIIQERGRTERIPVAQIVYFKAELKYVTVRTATRRYILDGSLNELEEKYRSDFVLSLSVNNAAKADIVQKGPQSFDWMRLAPA